MPQNHLVVFLGLGELPSLCTSRVTERGLNPLKDWCPDPGDLPAAVSHGALTTGGMCLDGAGVAVTTQRAVPGSQDQDPAPARVQGTGPEGGA